MVDVLQELKRLQDRVWRMEQRLAGPEPAPATRYRNVTAECHTSAGNDLIHKGCAIYLPYKPHNCDRYRLRKVCVNESEDSTFSVIDQAFIIEKEEA